MADLTPLDKAHAAMEAAGEDERSRLKFFEQFAASELFLLLQEEAGDENVTPEIFEVEGVSFVLVFDLEERLVEFTGQEAAYIAVSGRALADMLASEGFGLGLNLEVAPSSMLLPPEALAWLNEMLAEGPGEVEAQIQEVFPPIGLPEEVLTGLDKRLAGAEGLAELAYLVAVTYDSGAQGHLLGIIDAVPGTEPALARMVAEVMQFSGLEAAALDVGFFRASDAVAAKLAKVGLRFDLPKPEVPDQAPGAAPGMDPDKPPRLN